MTNEIEAYNERAKARRKFFDELDHSKELLDLADGIDYEVLEAAKVGLFDPSNEAAKKLYLKQSKEPEEPSAPSLIIPLGKQGMIDNANAFFEWPSCKASEGSFYFGLESLKQSKNPVYIVSNPMDVLAVRTSGGEALAILNYDPEGLEEILKESVGSGEELPPFIIRLNFDKKALITSNNIQKLIHKVTGSTPAISTINKDEHERLTDLERKERIALQELKEAGKEAEYMERRKAYDSLDFQQYQSVYSQSINLDIGVFNAQIREEMAEAKESHLRAKERQQLESYRYLQTASAPKIQDFLQGLIDNPIPYIKSGFPAFDKALGGGFEAMNVYVLGAESSIGKTSLMLQLADNLSIMGNHVLFFSLEMSKEELMAKSLSRLSFVNLIKKNYACGTLEGVQDLNIEPTEAMNKGLQAWNNHMNHTEPEEQDWNYWKCARSYSDILHNASKWDNETREALSEAAKYYHDHIKTLYVIESAEAVEGADRLSDKPSTETVRKAIVQHRERTGSKETVFVFLDYLQIISPIDDSETPNERQLMNDTISELRRIARQYNAVIFATSSINRNSYNQPIHIESLKESGGIEYGADKIIGLEPDCMGEIGKDNDLKKNREVMSDFRLNQGTRTVRLTILKNRGGTLGYSRLSNIGRFGYFAEEMKEDDE